SGGNYSVHRVSMLIECWAESGVWLACERLRRISIQPKLCFKCCRAETTPSSSAVRRMRAVSRRAVKPPAAVHALRGGGKATCNALTALRPPRWPEKSRQAVSVSALERITALAAMKRKGEARFGKRISSAVRLRGDPLRRHRDSDEQGAT